MHVIHVLGQKMGVLLQSYGSLFSEIYLCVCVCMHTVCVCVCTVCVCTVCVSKGCVETNRMALNSLCQMDFFDLESLSRVMLCDL